MEATGSRVGVPELEEKSDSPGNTHRQCNSMLDSSVDELHVPSNPAFPQLSDSNNAHRKPTTSPSLA
jgi:hypothetical protein